MNEIVPKSLWFGNEVRWGECGRGGGPGLRRGVRCRLGEALGGGNIALRCLGWDGKGRFFPKSSAIDCQRGSFLGYRTQAHPGLLSLSSPDQEGFLGAGQLYRIQWQRHVLTVSVDWDKLDREESSAFLQSPINDDNTGRAFCKVDVYGTLLLFNYI